jgi:hypothetical protein
MKAGPDFTYPPLGTLKPVADGVWIMDGPVIQFGMPWPKMPFPTRMTIIRCAGQNLLIHSPVALAPALSKEIEAIGQPRWIVAPNRIHYWWVADWHNAYPDAKVHVAPRVKEQAGARLDFECTVIEGETGHPWEDDLATLAIAGSYMTEIDFFHRASRTLILTDLIENFEPEKMASFFFRWLTWLGGVQHPHGAMPRDMRLTFPRPQLRVAVERMIAWEPERILLAHGRWYARDGVQELRRAFRWLLE